MSVSTRNSGNKKPWQSLNRSAEKNRNDHHFEMLYFFFVLVTARWSGDEFSFDQVFDARSITFLHG